MINLLLKMFILNDKALLTFIKMTCIIKVSIKMTLNKGEEVK